MSTPEGEPVTAAGFALGAILQGMSAREGLEAFRAAGGRIANQSWFRMTGELQAMMARREGIYDEPLHLRPTGAEVETWQNWRGRGYVQQVEVIARDKDTGEIISIPYSHITRNLVSRKTAIKAALQATIGEPEGRYNQQVLGAVYTGTYQGTGNE